MAGFQQLDVKVDILERGAESVQDATIIIYIYLPVTRYAPILEAAPLHERYQVEVNTCTYEPSYCMHGPICTLHYYTSNFSTFIF